VVMDSADEAFDTLIIGGDVVDPEDQLNGRLEIGVRGGRIAAVAPRLSREGVGRVVDATGQIVTPGLVDLHTHVYWGATYWGIEAAPVAARSGVTTWLDVGSAGAYTFPGFRRYIAEPSPVRVLALLNISAIGLVAPTWELANLDYCDVDLSLSIARAHPDLILGIKARIDRNTTRGTGLEPLRRARQLADAAGLPLMVHIGAGPPSLAEILDLLRPGDILTHCCTGQNNRLTDEVGNVRQTVRELWQRGLVLDIGHGTGSFSFEVAQAMLHDGILPDVISSDAHQLSVQGPMYDLPTTLSKFLCLGLTLPQVIERATTRPARAMGRPDLGTLRVGAPADLALFRLEEGDYTFYDVFMAARKGTQRLVNTLTIIGGAVLPLTEPSALHPWAVLPPEQQALLGHPPGVAPSS